MKRLDSRRDCIFVMVLVLVSAALFVIPSPSRSPYAPGSSLRTIGRIVDVDNSLVKKIGPIKEGDQQLEVRVLTGPFAGRTFPSANHLIGKIELDKLFAVGDRALVVLDLTPDRGDVAYANVLDHFRLDILCLIAAAFFAFLLLFGGWVGVKATLSFVFTAAVIFKVLLPSMLLGAAPIPTTLGIVAAITAAIIFLVGGLNRKSLVAFLGSLSGVIVTALLAELVTKALKIHGAVRPFTETLLYSGYGYLDLPALFSSGIFLASSGAIMDLGMDIASAMDEIVRHKPDIARRDLLKSGFTIGRLVIGTQTTTLLLAYSSGYSGMLMTFITQGLPAANALNLVYVSSELAHTLVGSLGLVLVAPLTAIAGALLIGGGLDKREMDAYHSQRGGELGRAAREMALQLRRTIWEGKNDTRS
jgi:uncharacterized membrane protein